MHVVGTESVSRARCGRAMGAVHAAARRRQGVPVWEACASVHPCVRTGVSVSEGKGVCRQVLRVGMVKCIMESQKRLGWKGP